MKNSLPQDQRSQAELHNQALRQPLYMEIDPVDTLVTKECRGLNEEETGKHGRGERKTRFV
jgi:hypothetical protein